MKMSGSKIAVACFATLLLSACAAGGVESAQAAHGGMLSLFFLGLWHGIISPVTLLVEIGHKLAPHAIPWALRFYETKTDSVVYDIGFWLGLGSAPTLLVRRWG
ncbi:MAG TPA: hypothetical protein VIJ59_06370 [Caulobacteraceae bacterium]